MFVNAKQRAKQETTQTLEDGPTDLLSGTGADGFFFFLVFVSATGQLIMKPLSFLNYSTLVFRGLVGEGRTSHGTICRGAC